MNKNLRLIPNFFLVAAPILASFVLGVSASKAATFGLSNSEVELINFSQIPENVDTFGGVNIETIGKGGMVKAVADADAEFFIIPPFATNSNISYAYGENQDYLGLAESESEIIGYFDIKADTDFSVDYAAILNLETSIDNPPAENARASGDISFFLYDIDNEKVLDYFNLTGNLVTEGDNDFVGFKKSDNVNVVQKISQPNFGGKEESLIAFVEGSVSRYFADDTNLALLEVKRNRVRVKAPEPSISLALLVSSGVIGVVLKRRRK